MEQLNFFTNVVLNRRLRDFKITRYVACGTEIERFGQKLLTLVRSKVWLKT